MIGSWRITHNSVFGYIGTVRVQYVGGAGTVATYRADGTFAVDWGAMQPRIARYGNETWSDVIRGTMTGRYRAAGGTLEMSQTKINATDTLRRSGKVNNSSTVTFALVPNHYTCSGNLMKQFADNEYTEEYERISR